MKRYPLWMLFINFLVILPIFAVIDTQDFGSELIFQVEENQDKGPFSFEIDFDAIRKSKFRDPNRPREHIGYSEAEIEARCVYFYNASTREGADLGLIYNRSNILWKNNPYFEQEKFNTATLSFGAFSQRWKAWFLHAEINMNVNADHISFFEYVNFDLLLVSRYAYCEHIGVYSGFIAQTGMKMDRVYPIAGIDWQISDKWFLNAVFPINVSAVYNYNEQLSFALAGRAFDNRLRLGKSEPLSKGLIHYTNSGIELAINWDTAHLSSNFHAGYAFGGKVRLSDQHNEHSHRYRFNAAGYLGGEASYQF